MDKLPRNLRNLNRTFEEIKEEFNKITENIKREFEQDDFSKVEVIPQYSDIYEAEEDNE